MKTITSSRLISLPVVLLFCCLSAVIFTNSVSSEGPAKTRAGEAKEAIRMFDIGFSEIVVIAVVAAGGGGAAMYFTKGSAAPAPAARPGPPRRSLRLAATDRRHAS